METSELSQASPAGRLIGLYNAAYSRDPAVQLPALIALRKGMIARMEKELTAYPHSRRGRQQLMRSLRDSRRKLAEYQHILDRARAAHSTGSGSSGSEVQNG